MYCTICGCPRQENEPFCQYCGAAFDAQPVYFPNPKPKRGWLPYVLLSVIALVGLALFFLIPMEPAEELSDPEVTASAQYREDCFILEGGVLCFDESKYSGSPVLQVPSDINGQPVTTIGEGCFEGVSGITTIVLPSSVTYIADRAFAGCTDLRGLFVPEAVTAIGAEAFRGCEKLESVYIPTAVGFVGADAFEGCPNLLWVFYSGFYEEWETLYPQPITPFIWAMCWDGEYLHAAQSS